MYHLSFFVLFFLLGVILYFTHSTCSLYCLVLRILPKEFLLFGFFYAPKRLLVSIECYQVC